MKRIEILIKERRSQLRAQASNITATAKAENRELTDDEKQEIEEIKAELQELKQELAAFNEEQEPETTEQSGDTETNEECEEDTEEDRNNEEDEPENNENTEDTDDTTETEEESSETSPEEQSEEEEQEQDNKRNIAMNKQTVSIFSAIKAVAEGRSFDSATQALVNETRKQMRNANMESQAEIVLPLTLENRALTFTDEEGDLATIEYKPILEALYANQVLNEIGATIINGASDEVKLPILGKSDAHFVSELASGGTAPSATSVLFKPHRVTCTVPLSNKLLAASSYEIENAVLNNIVGAIADKIQATIFSADSGVTGEKPAGILYSAATADTTDFAGVTAAEAKLEEKNFNNKVYVLAPSAKATFRQMIKGTNGTGMVFEHGEMDGAKAVSTSSVAANTAILMDPKYLYEVLFNTMDITVDKVTRAPWAETLITVGCWVDFKYVKEGGVIKCNTAE